MKPIKEKVNDFIERLKLQKKYIQVDRYVDRYVVSYYTKPNIMAYKVFYV